MEFSWLFRLDAFLCRWQKPQTIFRFERMVIFFTLTAVIFILMTKSIFLSSLSIFLICLQFGYAQSPLVDVTLNGKSNDIEAITSGVYCLENNDSLKFAYSKAMAEGNYVFQGIFIYGQLNLGEPTLLFQIPSISAPFTIAMRDLIPENKIPPYDKGGTRVSIVISRVLRVNGKRAEEVINIPREENLSLVVYTGCK